MKELSLFSGAGGGLLGTKLLGWQHVGYVEYNDYCQRVIRQRILDGILENAPIFGDIRAFLDEGYAASYSGLVDVVTAGFPCQPFSVAGKQQGEEDERNMWPETLAVLRTVRPRYALLENVPGLLAHEYGRRIFADLAESGFDARWRVLSAAEMGAPHKRDRLWIVCHAQSDIRRTSGHARPETPNGESAVSDALRTGGWLQQELADRENQTDLDDDGPQKPVAYACSERLSGTTREKLGKLPKEARTYSRGSTDRSDTARGGYWATEPDVGRVANGVANRVDRLKALGNGQIPAVVRAAWKFIVKDENSRG